MATADVIDAKPETKTKIRRIEVRRFSRPDLDRCGPWLLPRLVLSFPQQNERQIASWISSLLHSNEFLFVCSDNAVGLAQLQRADIFQVETIVVERFVFAATNQPAHIEEAAEMYVRFADWAKHHGARFVQVMEQTDVPADTVKDKVGRIVNKTLVFARV